MGLALALLLQSEPGADLVSLALRYLARHQAGDGSWGRRPAACACPEEPAPRTEAPDDAARARVAALLEELDADDPERRLAAQRELERFGLPAATLLADVPGSPEKRARAADVRRRILREATREDVELTSWALLTFLGSGYSHLSKDEYDGLRFGDVVRRGLAWLMERDTDSAAAALAVNEAYGLTGSSLYLGAARKATDRVAAAALKDERSLMWQVMALKSAEISDLPFPREAYETRLAALRERSEAAPRDAFLKAADVVATVFIRKSKAEVDLGRLPELDPSKVDIETAYLASLALFQYDGPGGPVWKAYREVEKRWILPSQIVARGPCARGAWAATGTAARIKTACHGALLNEIYVAYPAMK